jgi:hypothetical protein
MLSVVPSFQNLLANSKNTKKAPECCFQRDLQHNSFGRGVIHQKEGHRDSGVKGLGANVGGGITEHWFLAPPRALQQVTPPA